MKLPIYYILKALSIIIIIISIKYIYESSTTTYHDKFLKWKNNQIQENKTNFEDEEIQVSLIFKYF